MKQMNPEGATPTSLGFGVERHLQKSRSALQTDEKVEHLTCAIEALLMHLNYLEGDARAARDAADRPSETIEAPAPPEA